MKEEANNKLDHDTMTFAYLPNIQIQDPKRQSTFYIPSENLKMFEITPETLAKVNSATVTFVIPDEDILEKVQPFVDPNEETPSILIQYRREQVSFFLTYNELKKFQVNLDLEIEENNTITFFIPFGWESIEELPSLRVARASFHILSDPFLLKNL